MVAGEEFDSVFTAAPGAGLTVVQPAGRLAVTQSDTCPETVVWNPGPALSQRLADMPDDGWRHMLCVEAASIDGPSLVIDFSTADPAGTRLAAARLSCCCLLLQRQRRQCWPTCSTQARARRLQDNED